MAERTKVGEELVVHSLQLRAQRSALRLLATRVAEARHQVGVGGKDRVALQGCNRGQLKRGAGEKRGRGIQRGRGMHMHTCSSGAAATGG